MSWWTKYTWVKHLGEGAYGQVDAVRARDGRIVALKRIASPLPAYVEALFGEANKLWHLWGVPGVVRLVDHDFSCEEPWIALELMDESLHKRLGGRAQAPQLAAAIGLQLARAVRGAHSRGVLHLDLKPENVLILGGRLNLADFGSARGLASLVLSGGGGTPGYIAPERRRGVVTPASDIFAVGAVLYQVLTGRRPPDRRSALDPRWVVPSCQPELANLVRWMTAETPEGRPALVLVEEQCRRFINGPPGSAQPAAAQKGAFPPSNGNGGPALLAAAVLGAAGLFVGGPLVGAGVGVLTFLFGARGGRR